MQALRYGVSKSLIETSRWKGVWSLVWSAEDRQQELSKGGGVPLQVGGLSRIYQTGRDR